MIIFAFTLGFLILCVHKWNPPTVLLFISFVEIFLKIMKNILNKMKYLLQKASIWWILIIMLHIIIKLKYFFLINCRALYPEENDFVMSTVGICEKKGRVRHGFFKKMKPYFLILACLFSQNDRLEQN